MNTTIGNNFIGEKDLPSCLEEQKGANFMDWFVVMWTQEQYLNYSKAYLIY